MPERPEIVLPTVRALVVQELVERYGIRKSQVARALGISSASITQYLARARGSSLIDELTANKAALQAVKTFSEDLARRIKLGVEINAGPELAELALEVSKILKGMKVDLEMEGDRTVFMRTLTDRLKLEEIAAKRALEIAGKTRDELVRVVLRQIATDSLRHADIVSVLIHRFVTGDVDRSELPDKELIAELASYEQEAESSSLEGVIGFLKNPVAKALLNSIELDEKKHTLILKSLLEDSSATDNG